MSALVVSVLAQAIALNLGDRTEMRAVRDDTATDLEAETRPYARLSLSWPKSSLGIGYSPILTVAPLESSTARERRFPRTEDRHFELLHAADAQADVSFGSATTTLTLSQNVRVAQRNFRRELFSSGTATSSPQGAVGSAAPAAPAAPPDTGGTGAGGVGTGTGGAGTGGTGAGGAGQGATATSNPIASPAATPVTWVSESTVLSLNRALSARHSFSFSTGYDVEGGTNRKAQALFPLMHGPMATASVSSQLAPRDGLSTMVSAQYRFSRVGVSSLPGGSGLRTRTAIATATENLSHTFSPAFSGAIGAGVGYSRMEQYGRATDDGFLPTGALGLDYETIFLKGNFGAQVGVQFTPMVDPATSDPDWRYTSLAGLGWRGKRLALTASSQAQLSLTPDRSGGTRAFTTSAQATYDLLHGFNLDCGGRIAWFETAGVISVGPTEVLFVALSYGHQIPF